MVGIFDVTSCRTEEGNILMIRSGGRFYYDIMLFLSIWQTLIINNRRGEGSIIIFNDHLLQIGRTKRSAVRQRCTTITTDYYNGCNIYKIGNNDGKCDKCPL